MDDTEASRELQWLRAVRDLSHLLATEHEPRRLLSLILDAAIEITNAERGYLVRVRGRKPDGSYRFRVEVARGFDRLSLASEEGEVSRTVVKRVVESQQGLVTTHESDSDVLRVSSVMARKVLAILCAPMSLRGEIWGVLYLDHKRERDAFGEQDLTILGTFASQAALAMETAELRAGIQPQAQPQAQPAPRPALIGSSLAMRTLREQIERASRTDQAVLVVGESGTGKTRVANEVHAASRANAPFLVERLDAHDEKELELLLFGCEPGVLRPELPSRVGLFQRAGQGTLVLREVSALPERLQTKLLRVLQTQSVKPMGADREFPLGCRVVCTTTQDLREEVKAGRFREDLFYLLDVLRLFVPALRERQEDVLESFHAFAEEVDPRKLTLSPRAQELLMSYPWPGNVRELRNEARRLAGSSQRTVSAQQLAPSIQEGRGVSAARGTLSGKTLAEVEQAMIETAIRECRGNKSRAARQLGIPRTTLYHLIERYGITG
ncbi:MAG: sigma-54-dependent Fis family transcriptional regulator [Planctomycetes bacterium]|nr:sigma-54-dependent Fis family transcriptional regulator [Planctomycetota bacterium]